LSFVWLAAWQVLTHLGELVLVLVYLFHFRASDVYKLWESHALWLEKSMARMGWEDPMGSKVLARFPHVASN
jgi:hypothetical protein